MIKYNYGESLYEYSNRAKRERFWIYCTLKETPTYIKEFEEKDKAYLQEINGKYQYIFKVLDVQMRNDLTHRVTCQTINGRQFDFEETELNFKLR